MLEDLDAILARVAAGELSPQDAEPLVAVAIGRGEETVRSGEETPRRGDETVSPGAGSPQQHTPPPPPLPPPPPFETIARPQRTVRLQVTERGRSVVNLRIPVGLAGLAGSVVPGLSGPQSERIREALRSGEVGPILEVVDEDGDGVIISTE